MNNLYFILVLLSSTLSLCASEKLNEGDWANPANARSLFVDITSSSDSEEDDNESEIKAPVERKKPSDDASLKNLQKELKELKGKLNDLYVLNAKDGEMKKKLKQIETSSNLKIMGLFFATVAGICIVPMYLDYLKNSKEKSTRPIA
jgi:hypothetical protein